MIPASILVVEDEPDIAALLVHVLRDEGYRVLLAENGHVALQMLAAMPVDLVLTDLTMPVMSGHDLIRAVRANPLLQAIPILVVSAVPEELVRDNGSSFAAFVQKPFRTRQLKAKVGALIAQRVTFPSSSEG